jgi:hypothetical protein
VIDDDPAVIPGAIAGTTVRDRRRKAGMTVNRMGAIGRLHLYGIEVGQRNPTVVVVTLPPP